MNYNKSKQKKQTVRKKMNSTTAAVGTKTSTDRKTKKFKIVERKKLDPALPDYNEFRLFDFQAYDYRNTDTKVTSYNFQIRMFGINTVGETCVLFVNNFRPFFYVQVPSTFNQIRADDLFIHYRDHANIPKYLRSEFLHAQLESHQKLYEFTGSTSYKFLKLTFKTTRAFRQCKMLLSSKTLDAKMRYPTYESNIPPLLRYFHIYSISPSGWVRLDHKETIPCEIKTSQCTYEYICSTRQIHPLPSKETPVPYKIASFDIEASSSHGDFPLPVKDYKRLASQIIDLIEAKKQKQSLSYKAIQLILKKSIKAAFGTDTVDDIDCVYPKIKPTKERINQLCERFITMTIADDSIQNQNNPLVKAAAIAAKIAEAASATDGSNNEENGGGDHEKMAVEIGSSYAKKDDSTVVYSKEDLQKTIGQYLLDSKHTREQKIHTVNTALSEPNNGFPTLKGDEITFIGTTFLKNGSMEPYKNHCLVVNSCTPVEGVEIVSVPDEKQCILNWTDLIQQEDPDIIIGYNIFGFDYQFMFQRAKELSIVEEFCMLSRINNEVCAKQDYKTQEYQLDHTQNRLASGDYDLHYPCISGRLQIDLLFYFRRDYNLSSYKLDDVAGTMIRDDIKGLEIRKVDNQTRLYSKNLAGLHVGDFIHLEITSFTTDYYADGRKFRVLQIDRDVTVDESLMSLLTIPTGTYNVITIEGLHTALNPKTQNLKWGMAKDDVSPQDIFRLSKESAESRAIVAKYCIQDCNLVHHLMKKVDVLTGYNEMSRICNVPISFLVFRGQGIKLTSYVAKVCREKDTLMPDLEKVKNDDGYEGAIVLPPKCEMYGENPVACVDYSSLYPSIAKGWNLSPNSKVWTKTFDLTGKLIKINTSIVTGKNCDILLEKAARYDNLSNYKYINVTFDNYEQVKKFDKNGKLLKTEKVKSGYKEVRWAKFPTGQEGIIPSIIGDLLKARKETRKKAESEPDPFLANVLDKRQLGYKVTANSLYGQMGSSVSTFFEKDVAASITSIGRQMITYAKRMVEEIYGNSVYELKSGTGVRVVGTKSQYVYGDSVANYTPVCVRVDDTVQLVTIDSLAEKYGMNKWEQCLEEGKQTKECCELIGVDSWTENGWTPLKRVIRHILAPHKKMIRVLTHTGVVDVTDDHSLVQSNGEEISPKDVTIGTELLHHNLPILAATVDNGSLSSSSSSKMFHSQLEAAQHYYLLCNSQNNVSLDYDESNNSYYVICNHEVTSPNAVKKIHPIDYEGYVYDLTTGNHHFAAGIGNMIVHNTDSVFFTFNLEDPQTGAPIRGKDALEITIEIAQEAANLCSLFLPPPMKLAYEKTLMSFILLSKKRYVGMLYEFNPNKGKLKFMGLPLKRRDSCDYLKDVYGGILTILMKEPDNVQKAIEFLNDSLQSLVDGGVSIDKLALTKSLRSNYKNPLQIAHKVLADRVGEREPGNKPKPGDRIKYAFIENKGQKLLGDRVETLDFIAKHELPLDYHYYITNQLMNPLLQLFSLALDKVYIYKNFKQKQIVELNKHLDKMYEDCDGLIEPYMKKREKYCSGEVKKLLFDPFLTKIYNAQNGIRTIMQFWGKA